METSIFKKYNTPIKGGALLKPLIELRGHQCECCKNTEWLGQPINLQVHHIDGDRTNNELDNLQLLCLNCHSYTDNFGSKNIKKASISDEEFIQVLRNSSSIRQALFTLKLSDAGANYTRARKLINESHITFSSSNKTEKENYCICGKSILPGSQYCYECRSQLNRVVERPNREELKRLIRSLPFVKIGERYNVSDNAVRKWCKFYNLPSKKTEINNYTDEVWNNI